MGGVVGQDSVLATVTEYLIVVTGKVQMVVCSDGTSFVLPTLSRCREGMGEPDGQA